MYTTRPLHFQRTRPFFAGPPSQEQTHRAHTITQRLKQLKKIPPELIPLGIVLAVALGAAGYSMVNKLMTDKTLRLTRQGKIEMPSPKSKDH